MSRSGVARISRLAVSIVLIALGVTQTAPVEVNAAGERWFNDSWQFRKEITIDATKVSSGPHTNFPVLVNLTSDASLATNAQADGDDILFTSSGGATQLSHEIEKYGSSTGALVAWVKVPSLPSSTDTGLLYVLRQCRRRQSAGRHQCLELQLQGGLPPEGRPCGCRRERNNRLDFQCEPWN